MEKKPMYMLTYDHGGYILWGPHFASSMQSAIEWMTKYPKFKIGLDNEAYCYDRYAAENPEIIDLLNDVKTRFPGRFSIGSVSYGQPLAVFINEESNVRQITYAIRSDEAHLHTRPYVYAISEHAYHSQVPQLALQAGYKMALLRTHFQMYGYNPTYDSSFGTWYGDDGSGIPTIPTYAGQGAHFGSTTMDNYIMTRWPRSWDIPIEEFEKQFNKYEPLLASRYDDVIQRCEELTAHVEEVENYQWVTLEDLFDIYAPYKDSKDEYRPGANEFVVRMPWGYCGNQIFNNCRKNEVLVAQAERLNAMAKELGMVPDQTKLENAWKNLMISQHHDVQICGLLKEATEFTEKCRDYGTAAKERALNWIAGKMKSGKDALLVVNYSDKPVTNQVSLDVNVGRPDCGFSFDAVCGDEIIPCSYDVLARIASGVACRYRVRFNVTLPAMTARVYEIRRKECADPCKIFASYENGVLTTDSYEIALGSGGILSVKDRTTGSYLIKNPGNGRLFAGIIEDAPAESNGMWNVRCRPMIAEAVYQGEVGGIPCRFILTCNEGEKLLRCRMSFHLNGEKIGIGRTFEFFKDNTNGFIHEEKLRFVMDVPFSGAVSGLRDRPFLVAATDDKYVQGNYWAAVGNDTLGMAVFNEGSMCVTREGENTLSVPLAYSNLYAWGDKCLYGDYEHAFALYPLQGGMNAEEIHNAAIGYTYPLVTRSLEEEHDGKDAAAFLPIVTDDNIRMSAYYPENGKQILRVYEFGGKEGKFSVPGYRLTQINLLNEKIADVNGDTFTVKPHQVCSFFVEKL